MTMKGLRKLLILLITVTFAASAFACKRPIVSDSQSTSTENSESTADGEEPIVKQYFYNVVVQKLESGTVGGTLAQNIQKAQKSVVEFYSAYSSSVTGGSAVVFGKGVFKKAVEAEPELPDSATEDNSAADSDSSAASATGIATSVASDSSDSATLGGESVSDGTGEDGYTEVSCSFLLTCHTLIEGAHDYSAVDSDGTVYSAYLIGSDPFSNIAVFAVEADLDATVFATSDVFAGQQVFGVGNAKGVLGGSVSTGIVSYASRLPSVTGAGVELTQTNLSYDDVGEGAGLFDAQTGALIGIIGAGNINEELKDIGFAVPADTAFDVACGTDDDLPDGLLDTYTGITPGYVKGRLLLGAQFKDSPKLWGGETYVYVSDIDIYGSMYKGDIRINDKIVSVTYRPKEGEQVTHVTTTAEALEDFFAGLDLQIGDTLIISRGRDNVLRDVAFKIRQYIYGN